jgi:hypothetical protein
VDGSLDVEDETGPDAVFAVASEKSHGNVLFAAVFVLEVDLVAWISHE